MRLEKFKKKTKGRLPRKVKKLIKKFWVKQYIITFE